MHTIFRRALHPPHPSVVKSSLLVLFFTLFIFYLNTRDHGSIGLLDLNVTAVDNKAEDSYRPTLEPSTITQTNSTFHKKLRILEETVNRLLDNKDFYKRYKTLHSEKIENLSLCTEYTTDAKHEKFYISQIWKNELSIKPGSVTYVTQLTMSRLNLIDKIQEQWSGPLSISIYLELDEILSFKEKLLYYSSVIERDNIDFHIVLATGVSTTFMMSWG